MDAWISALRKRATSRRFETGASGLLLSHPAPTEPDGPTRMARAIERLSPEDLTVPLQLSNLLADRVTIGLAIVRAIFRGIEGLRYLHRLRARVPQGRSALNWLRNTVGMSQEGAICVSEAMRSGDFDAIATLTSPEVRESSDEFDPIHMRSFYPLREAEARILLQLIFEEPEPDRVRWILIGDAEELIGGGSPHASAFRSGVRTWLQDFLRMPNTAVVFNAWAPTRPQVHLIDAALEREVFTEPGPEAPDLALDTQPITLERIAAGLSLLASVPLEPRAGEPVWAGAGDRGVLVTAWPDHTDDPARWIPQRLTPAVDSWVGGSCAVVLPRWAMGDLHSTSRQSLIRAARLRWVPISCAEAVALSTLGARLSVSPTLQPLLDRLLLRIQQAWSLTHQR